MAPMPIAEELRIDAAALLRLIKHSRDSAPRPVFGKLLGMQLRGVIEVTTVYPSVVTSMWGTQLSEEQRDEQDAQADKETLEHMKHAGLDTFPVGIYVGCPHSTFYVARNLRSMMEGAASGNPCVMLVYDPFKTMMGHLSLRAFVPTARFAEYNKTNPAYDAPLNLEAGLLQQIPVTIVASTLNQMVLYDVASRPRAVSNAFEQEGGEQYLERSAQLVTENLDKLKNDMKNRVPTVEKALHIRALIEQTSHIASISRSTVLKTDLAQHSPSVSM